MPILDLQRRLRELGRIRIGAQEEFVKDGKTKRRPTKLGTFRLTSPTATLIAAAAEAYGGTPRPWLEGQWEVITEATALDIVVPPGQAVSQWNEMWSGGGCQRRCDGVTNVITMTSCACPADPVERSELAAKGEACKPTTRLSVMLPAIPDLGTWRLESHGWHAAIELAGAAEVLSIATAAGRLIPARLGLEERTRKAPGKPTARFVVPIIQFVDRLADLALPTGVGLPQLAAPQRPALPSTTLPTTSDFRAPLPGSTLTEPEPEVAQSSAASVAVAARPVAAPPAAKCGAPSPPQLDAFCGMLAGHLDDPRAPRVHRELDEHGVVVASWPAA